MSRLCVWLFAVMLCVGVCCSLLYVVGCLILWCYVADCCSLMTAVVGCARRCVCFLLMLIGVAVVCLLLIIVAVVRRCCPCVLSVRCGGCLALLC